MKKNIFIFGISIFLFSCAYSGPQLTSVISNACSSSTQFVQFKNCINNFWYRQVVNQGYGNDNRVRQYNYRLDLLSQAVNSRQMTDIQAINDATSFAYILRSDEQAAIQRNQALLQVISGTTRVTSPTTSAPSTVRCSRIGDITNLVYTFNSIACPAGYAPTR